MMVPSRIADVLCRHHQFNDRQLNVLYNADVPYAWPITERLRVTLASPVSPDILTTWARQTLTELVLHCIDGRTGGSLWYSLCDLPSNTFARLSIITLRIVFGSGFLLQNEEGLCRKAIQ